MNTLLDLSDDDIRALISIWREGVAKHEAELEEMKSKIASAEATLNGGRLAPTPRDTAGGKRRKGENLRLIAGYLGRLNGAGATQAEISKNAKVSMSSTHLILTKKTDLFAKGTDGLWHMKPMK